MVELGLLPKPCHLSFEGNSRVHFCKICRLRLLKSKIFSICVECFDGISLDEKRKEIKKRKQRKLKEANRDQLNEDMKQKKKRKDALRLIKDQNERSTESNVKTKLKANVDLNGNYIEVPRKE